MDILDDMLAGVGRTMQDYLKYEENGYYPPLPNGHQLFVHSTRRVAIRSAIAMGKEGDMIVSFLKLGCSFLTLCNFIPHYKRVAHYLSLYIILVTH